MVATAAARADVASDEAGAIIVFPKIIVDSERGLDTLVRLSNTSDREVSVLCFYVNATPKCTLPTRSCFPDRSDCDNAGGFCVPQWQESDFRIRVTSRQPVVWLASQRASVDCANLIGACSNDEEQDCRLNRDCAAGGRCVLPPCFPIDDPNQTPNQESNLDSAVIPVPEDPFIGELKCIAVDESFAPIPRNVLKGEGIIGHRATEEVGLDVAGYNALGIPAVEGRGNRDNTLVIGGPRDSEGNLEPQVEYEGCPNILILDHYFDGAVDPLVPNACLDSVCSVSRGPCDNDDDCVNRCEGDTCTLSDEECEGDEDCSRLLTQARVATDLTLIPCTQDFRTQQPGIAETVAQFLVFNEFEQRFSTSRTVNCFEETRLSNIDTKQNERSIFSAGVTGTLTGQTRIRGVDVGAEDHGNTLIGLAEEFRCVGPGFPQCSLIRAMGLISSSATNLHFQGTRAVSDFLYLP